MWKYSLHAHKNRNGTHYDFMIGPEDEGIAYSWSTKTVPFRGTKSAAYRTRDHLCDDMEFNGEFITKNGSPFLLASITDP